MEKFNIYEDYLEHDDISTWIVDKSEDIIEPVFETINESNDIDINECLYTHVNININTKDKDVNIYTKDKDVNIYTEDKNKNIDTDRNIYTEDINTYIEDKNKDEDINTYIEDRDRNIYTGDKNKDKDVNTDTKNKDEDIKNKDVNKDTDTKDKDVNIYTEDINIYIIGKSESVDDVYKSNEYGYSYDSVSESSIGDISKNINIKFVKMDLDIHNVKDELDKYKKNLDEYRNELERYRIETVKREQNIKQMIGAMKESNDANMRNLDEMLKLLFQKVKTLEYNTNEPHKRELNKNIRKFALGKVNPLRFEPEHYEKN